ncbi:MAG: HAD-IC family P-type ATPase, partial [Myxococcales bacterium]|nr:HAD-IC family P-type ATPase [Myxococcales bacterium]
ICARGCEGIEAANEALAGRGLRVLAVGVGEGDDEASLELVGLIGIADPPRPEVIDAIAAARRAGITTVMITGDHPRTAAAIAHELGILGEGESAGDDGGDPTSRVHARATPEEKLTIIRAWRGRGAVVAMTGDGINDAPALREAHVGIAMGRSGTEVTREAGDIVLTEDNFADIIEGVREGRGVFDNIRKSLIYLLSGNAGELGVMLTAAIVGLPLPFLPLQILWINLVTDALPALALVMDPADAEVMDAPPRAPAEPILGRREWAGIALVGLLNTALVVAAFAWALGHRDLAEARSFAFSVLVFGELLRAFAARSPTRTLWQVGALSNLRLLAIVALSVVAQLVVLRWSVSASFFSFGALSWGEIAVAFGLGMVPVSVIEVVKLIRQARSHHT